MGAGHALLQADRLLKRFRTGFLGKASPVHFFWGSFDLAVTRFSGRRASPHPGGVPNLPDSVVREAYSHEVSSAGFWPGGPGTEEAVFYSYAYPEPPGFRETGVAPPQARYDAALGEFLLPYEAVRTASDPAAMLLAFLSSSYAAARTRRSGTAPTWSASWVSRDGPAPSDAQAGKSGFETLTPPAREARVLRSDLAGALTGPYSTSRARSQGGSR